MKRIALIGHRGVGKTSLLSRIETYLGSSRVRVIDLDREIERVTTNSIHRIFQESGEAAFRAIEQSTFAQLAKKTDEETLVVALGAGFDVSKIPQDWHVIWVRRVTDKTGRIFTDRPRLNPDMSALEEFDMRARAREPRYAARADAILILDEGIEDSNDPAERSYFTRGLDLNGATLTLQKENFARDFSGFIRDRLKWNLKWFELRDDLLSESQIEEAVRLIPDANSLLSFREPSRIAHSKSLHVGATDWALELGDPQIEPSYVSLHSNDFSKLSHPRAKLKAAVPTNSFDDLLRGHRWQQEEPDRRVFLPMSPDGRWAWYRDHRRDFSLNFIRENTGSAPDQPTLLQWQRHPDTKSFAAVLGDPVQHSRTPMEHRSYFAPHAVYAIRVTEDEWSTALPVLRELGLTHAAVTAPLKIKAQELAHANSPINTLIFEPSILGANTDVIGLREAAAQIPPYRSAAVWGGGGTLDSIREVFPQAEFVSARTGLLRDTGGVARAPELVIWAAPSKQIESPPAEWRPKFVFDLNYSDASAGRDYALKTKAIYISGLGMFKAQAKAQRQFWETV